MSSLIHRLTDAHTHRHAPIWRQTSCLRQHTHTYTNILTHIHTYARAGRVVPWCCCTAVHVCTHNNQLYGRLHSLCAVVYIHTLSVPWRVHTHLLITSHTQVGTQGRLSQRPSWKEILKEDKIIFIFHNSAHFTNTAVYACMYISEGCI